MPDRGGNSADRIAAMQIKEVVTAPRPPWQNAYVERVIGPIARQVTL